MGLTPQLYDDNEEKWKLKVHVGCGGIYLQGYWNVDIAGILAHTNSQQCELNMTTIGNYYGRLEPAVFPELPARHPTVCDEFMDMADLGYPLRTVDKIVAVQSFEHLSPHKAINALVNWWGILKPRGVVILSVPDMRETIEMLKLNESRDFAIRHLIGSARDQFNFHQAWYTREGLRELLESIGFGCEPLLNFHTYPSIVYRAHKE